MTTPWKIGPEPDQVISYGTSIDQVIDIYDGDGPLVTLIHGGYWRPVHNREHMRALAGKLVSHGFRVANIEYRRDPGNPRSSAAAIPRGRAPLRLAVRSPACGGHLG